MSRSQFWTSGQPLRSIRACHEEVVGLNCCVLFSPCGCESQSKTFPRNKKTGHWGTHERGNEGKTLLKSKDNCLTNRFARLLNFKIILSQHVSPIHTTNILPLDVLAQTAPPPGRLLLSQSAYSLLMAQLNTTFHESFLTLAGHYNPMGTLLKILNANSQIPIP